MKGKILVGMLLLEASMQIAKAQKIILHMRGNQKVEYNISQVDSISFINSETYEWVDLDLPSGTLWAACNVGAKSPEECGDFFAWGETSPKKSYFWNTYKHSNSSYNAMIRYCSDINYGYKGFTDNLTELLPEDDAAMVIYGKDWQTPSHDDYRELINTNYTTTVWTTKNGVNGCYITSKSNDKSIFLPAADYRQGTSISYENRRGYYWTRTLSTLSNDCGYYLYFHSNYYLDDVNIGEIGIGHMERYKGLNVRPVRIKTQR